MLNGLLCYRKRIRKIYQEVPETVRKDISEVVLGYTPFARDQSVEGKIFLIPVNSLDLHSCH